MVGIGKALQSRRMVLSICPCCFALELAQGGTSLEVSDQVPPSHWQPYLIDDGPFLFIRYAC